MQESGSLMGYDHDKENVARAVVAGAAGRPPSPRAVGQLVAVQEGPIYFIFSPSSLCPLEGAATCIEFPRPQDGSRQLSV